MVSTQKKPTSPCGGCTVCCRLLEVEEVPGGPKPALTNCRWLHKGAHTGCSIYKDRPLPCQKFECHYLKLERRQDIFTPSTTRPDKSGVMIVQLPSRINFVAHVYDPMRRDAWKQEDIWVILNNLCQQGFKVIVSWGLGDRLLLQRDGYGGVMESTLPPLEAEDEKAALLS